ncbi:MAG TPA: LuxR C-terminal-related transcriptional regulator [Acidimicrobiia bacterium]
MEGNDGASEERLPVREEIVVSWFRSARSGVRFDRLHVPYDADVDGEGRLAWAAGPVLQGLAEDLAETHNAVVLTDQRSHVLARHVPDRGLRTWLDNIQLAPGFRYGENEAGTNAIGTALALGRPFVVEGGEHFADILATMACAAVPVTDPRSGDLLGVIDLSCRAEDASPLMLPVAKRAAWEIEQRLLGDLSPAERILRDHFLNARRRTRGLLVSVSQTSILANGPATRALQPGDHELLWEWVARAVATHQALPAEIPLTGGPWIVKRLEAIGNGGVFVGATLRLSRPPGPGPTGSSNGNSSQGSADRPRFGWASLTATELSVATLVAEGLTNRQVAAKLYLSPHTVGFHLRQVFRKLEISSRVELTRLVVENETAGPTAWPGVR